MSYRNFLLISPLLLAGCDVQVFITGNGVVTVQDPAQTKCDSAPACFSASRGSSITLNANAAEGYVFAGWGGACSAATGTTCTLVVSGNRRVQATFLPESDNTIKALMQPGTEYFFTAPWPNDAYSRNENGTINIDRMPLPESGIWADQLRKITKQTKGFGTQSGVYFQAMMSQESWNSFRYLYSNANLQDAGFFLNIDKASSHYGETIPGKLRIHDTIEDHRNGMEPPLESRALFMLTPELGYVLRPKTTYAAIITSNSLIGPADLLSKLDQPYERKSGYSEQIFNALRAQKHAIDAASIHAAPGTNFSPDISAFTVFTTQDPKITDHAIKETLDHITDEQIIARSAALNSSTVECERNGYSRIDIATRAPNFLTGKSLYLFGGGDILINDGQAQPQGENALVLQVYRPCIVGNTALPLIVHANYTGNSGTESDFETRNAISVFLTAPEAHERVSPSTQNAIDFLRKLNIYAASFVDYLVDFNFFNLNAAKNQHLQYGAELAYSVRVAKLLPQIIERTSEIDGSLYSHSPNNVTLSGWSLGGIVTLHALAQGADADNVTAIRVPRPSALHFDSIAAYLNSVQPGISERIRDYVGVRENMPTQPTLQVLQTVLESMDTLNYMDELAEKNFAWVLSPADDNLHGGIAGYSVAKNMVLQLDTHPVQTVRNGPGSHFNWTQWGVNRNPLGLDALRNLENTSMKFVLSQDDSWSVSINFARCLPSALENSVVDLSYINEVVDQNIQCR